MNHVTVAGNLGADPEVRFTASGQKVTTLRLAAKSRKGSNRDETIWWRVTVWGEQFDKLIAFLKKGSSIIVVGELSPPEIFTDKEGQPRISMNLTAFTLSFSPFGRPKAEGEEARSSHDHEDSQDQGRFGQGKLQEFAEEEMPF